jgi:transcriptional regulator with XRE-family HTH domain
MGELGNRIQFLRHKRGLTVRALAEALDKTAGYLSRVKTREEIPASELICQMADVLKEKPEALLALAKKDLLRRAEQQIERKSTDALNLYRRSRCKKQHETNWPRRDGQSRRSSTLHDGLWHDTKKWSVVIISCKTACNLMIFTCV